MEENILNTEKQKKEGEQKKIHRHCCGAKREFNLGSFFLGLLIVLIGLIYLAKNLGWVDISLNLAEWKTLWPVLLIIIGLSMISCRGFIGTLFGIIISLVILALVIVLIFNIFNIPIWNNFIIIFQ